jgi:hypothetical protein
MNPTLVTAGRSELRQLGRQTIRQAGSKAPAHWGDNCGPITPGQREALSEQPYNWLANAGSSGAFRVVAAGQCRPSANHLF